MRETPEEYATRRASETKKTYIVTREGHAFMLRGNKKLAEELGGIASAHKPQK